MKILLTGGGSGGHFYPLIAIAEEINSQVKEEKLLPVELFFMSDSPYDAEALLENNITFIKVSAGKARRYFSILNFFDLFKTAYGVMSATIKIFRLYPDVVFSKGAYTSFPVLFAARILRIPVIIHESDSVPGRSNAWAGKFAKRIAISYPETAKFFDEKKVALTGNPIRKSILQTTSSGAKEYLNIEENIPSILILGGSLGAQLINEEILNTLPQLLDKYYVIHQTGKANIEDVIKTSEIVLLDNPHKNRYKPFDYLDNLHLSMSAGASDLIISRAGSTIFEIANWGKPSIIIPITDSNGDHQRENAYNYARFGGATVIEEANLTPNVLIAEINRILGDKALAEKMSAGAKSFVKLDSAKIIAGEILKLALQHEQ
jgi:UDP-N-acetylglucosamine--N-acetylmuramyl-(pentapeptide) pyrophosphoryl-undecaprenol N-acetylglucosamine transferase